MALARTLSRSLGMGGVALGLATAPAAPAGAHAWWLSVDEATMAWSLALTAEALDMLSAAGLAAGHGDDPASGGPAQDDPTNVDEARDSRVMSVRAMVLLSQIGLEVYPINGPERVARVAIYRFDVTSGQGAADDAGWHDVISFSPNCHGCADATDTLLDLEANFTLPPEPTQEN